MNFLDIKTDYAFKMLFGDEKNKDILISFLNSLIEFPDQHQIQDLTIKDPYNLPLLEGMKETFVDVKALLDTGEQILIEMQVLNHDGFEKRVLYNACKNYSMQLVKGEEYDLLNPVIALNIVDFDMFQGETELISHFKLLEKKRFTKYSGDIELIFIELPKFQKALNDLKELKEEWIYFVKYAEQFDAIPQQLDSNVQKAFQVVNTAAMTPDELDIMQKRKEFVSVIKGTKQHSFQKGRQEGIEQGIEQGEQQKALDIAKKLLANGMDLDAICNITGLSKNHIQSL